MGRGFWCGANGPLSSPKGDLIDLDPSGPHVRVSEAACRLHSRLCWDSFLFGPFLISVNAVPEAVFFLRGGEPRLPNLGSLTWALLPSGLMVLCSSCAAAGC